MLKTVATTLAEMVAAKTPHSLGNKKTSGGTYKNDIGTGTNYFLIKFNAAICIRNGDGDHNRFIVGWSEFIGSQSKRDWASKDDSSNDSSITDGAPICFQKRINFLDDF